MKDVRGKRYTGSTAAAIITLFRKGYQYWDMFKVFLPNPDAMRFGELSAYISKISAPKKHTPWIPLETSLLTLNKSVDMIINHADNIVQFYDVLLTELESKGHLDRGNRHKYKKIDVLKSLLPSEIKEHFNIVSFSRFDEEFKKYSKNVRNEDRTGLSFTCLLELLKASCFILIAGLKPIRMEEIVRLPYNCLFQKRAKAIGWFILL